MEKAKDNSKIYYIHDNGARPFRVVINKTKTADKYHVMVYERKYSDNSGDIYEDIAAYEFDTDQIFVGKSELNRMTEYSGGYGDKFDGNTILLHADDHKYIYIGSEIFVFGADNEIVSYKSPVGNNDVPYPYAVDAAGNIYLLVENVVLHNNSTLTKRLKKYDNPYDYYYDYFKITPDIGTIPVTKPKIKNFHDIAEYYIGNDQYTLRYDPDPESKYDRVIPELGDAMYIVNTAGKKIRLSKKAYVELMKEYGNLLGFGPIKYKHHVQKLLKNIY